MIKEATDHSTEKETTTLEKLSSILSSTVTVDLSKIIKISVTDRSQSIPLVLSKSSSPSGNDPRIPIGV